MASISTQSGRRMIQFIGSDGKRRSIRLGKLAQRDAVAVKLKVENLATAAMMGHAPSRETAQWVAGLDGVMRDKLAAVGLVEHRARATLGAFIDDYCKQRADVKPATQTVYARTRRYLVGFFGEDRRLDRITSGDADAWRLDLVKQGKADNTVRRACGMGKQFFTAAMRRELVQSNPFDGLPSVVRGNASRQYYVSQAEAAAVLDACPDAEWRLLFALARYGGLRVPSEILPLRWADIDWDRGRFLVHSPKTERNEGGESRVVPIFTELLPYLREAFELAPDGTEFCITRYRHHGVNLGTQLRRIIERAGLMPWPKLWQNLRSTRQTELEDHPRIPLQAICAWIGNSERVANRHYLQVTDEHFALAAGGAEALQNPVQQAHATKRAKAHALRNGSSEVASESAVSGDVQPVALSCSTDVEGNQWAVQDSNL